MFTIVLASNKGGTGKTTLAINLAVASGEDSLVIDLDPQGSAAVWSGQRQGGEPGVIGIQGYQLEKTLASAKDNGAAYVFIDTAPHSESTALAACRIADLVLCPCRPSLPDIRAIAHSADMVKLAKSRGYIVLNAVPTSGLKVDAQRALQSSSLPLCPITIGQRIAFNHSFTAGLGVKEYDVTGKATGELNRLWDWVVQELSH